jgi:cellulose synthase/poly-beta-1,6-N-acetylglucosamine synthase-like glycosyltransferase
MGIIKLVGFLGLGAIFITIGIYLIFILAIKKWVAQLPLKKQDYRDVHSVSIIVPVFQGGERLMACLESVKLNFIDQLECVFVIWQNTPSFIRTEIETCYCRDNRFKFIELSGIPSKSRAVNLALGLTNSKWVVLLDSDTVLRPDSIKRLLISCNSTIIAVYGFIVPNSRKSSLLQKAIWADKMVSHGVLRLGRYCLGLWPNLPGQCYAIQTNILRKIYNDHMGHLDDLSVTMKIVKLGGKIEITPVVLGEEENRISWTGLLAQRIRWTLGLIESAKIIFTMSRKFAQVASCWLLHAWLYHGCMIVSLVSIVFVGISGYPTLAGVTLLIYWLIWTWMALIGNKILSKIDETQGKKIYFLSTLFSFFIIMVAQITGAILAPLLLAVNLKRSILLSLLYKR